MSKSYRYTFQSADGFKTSTDNYDGTEAERYDAAMKTLSEHCAMDPAEWIIGVETDDEDAGTAFLYRSVADADADPDGSRADAWVKRITVAEGQEVR